METLADFVARPSNEVGCYYHRLEKSGRYPLKRNNTIQRGELGVFGFIWNFVTIFEYILARMPLKEPMCKIFLM